MTTLVIHDVPELAARVLRERAGRTGRTIEDEARALLVQSVQGRSFSEDSAREAAAEFRDLIRAANGGKLPRGAVEALLANRRAEAAREESEHADRMYDHVRWGLK